MSFRGNLEKLTLENGFYRRVIHTTPQQQLVLMVVDPGHKIGCEVHSDTTQFFRFEMGHGVMRVDNKTYRVKDGVGVVVGPDQEHCVYNTGVDPLKFYTIYSPPHHPDNQVDKIQPFDES